MSVATFIASIPLVMAGAGVEDMDTLFGVGWVGIALTALFWFSAVIVFMLVARFIWPPKKPTVIDDEKDA